MKWKFDYNGSDFTEVLSNLTQVKVFKEIVYNCNKQNLKWAHTEEERKRICAKVKVSEVTFKRALKEIAETRLLIKLGRGSYQVNGEYVSYGQHGI